MVFTLPTNSHPHTAFWRISPTQPAFPKNVPVNTNRVFPEKVSVNTDRVSRKNVSVNVRSVLLNILYLLYINKTSLFLKKHLRPHKNAEKMSCPVRRSPPTSKCFGGGGFTTLRPNRSETQTNTDMESRGKFRKEDWNSACPDEEAELLFKTTPFHTRVAEIKRSGMR